MKKLFQYILLLACCCTWVHNAQAQFYSAQITSAEFFWGTTDPGAGNGTALTAVDGNYSDAIEQVFKNANSVPNAGLNVLNVRFKGNNNTWGSLFKTVVNRDASFVSDFKITQGEYYIDTDNGAGNNIALLAFDGNFNDAIEAAIRNSINAPAIGLHTLGVRMLGIDGAWGTAFTTIFNVDASFVSDFKITQGEYYIDTDNGAGNNIALLAFDGNFNNAVEAAIRNSINAPTIGLHTLGVRMLGIDGAWGTAFTTIFNVDASFVSDFKITSGEYFFDTDPGQGSGIPLLAFDGNYNNAIEQTLNSGINAPSLGLHSLNVRLRAIDGTWGSLFATIINTDALFSANFRIVQAEYYFDTDPGQGNATPMIAFDGNFNNAVEIAISSAATGALSLGNHILSVRMKGLDNTWGSVFSSVVVVDPCTPAPTATITAGGAITFCPGDSVTLNANTGAGLTYQWRKDGLNIANAIASNYRALQSGVYDVAVRNAGGCTTISNSITVTVAGSSAPIVTITANPGNLVCPNTSVTFTAVPTNGGTTPTYQWQLNGNNVGLNQNTYSNSSLAANDVLRVIMTSNAGCVFPLKDTSNLITMQLLAAPNNSVSPSGPTTFCAGNSITLTVAPGNTYLWSTGATTQSIFVNTANTYSVTVTGSNSCTAASLPITTIVNTNPTPIITPGGATTFCQGGNVNLTASGGNTYLWNTGATTALINVTTNGSATVTVTNANSCTASTSQNVTVINNPTVTITPSGSTTICQGNTVNLTAGGATTYVWSTSATTSVIAAGASITYSVTGTISGGCTGTASQAVLVNTNPTATITPSGPTSFCQGGSVSLAASGGVSYVWNTGATTSNINVTTGGTYIVTVSNANGCTASASQVVNVSGSGTATITPNGPTTFCVGGNVNLTASGGTSYAWSNSLGSGATVSVSPTTNTTYTVTVTNASNCTATATQSIIVNALPNAQINPSTSAICTGQSVSLTASGGASYNWSTNQTINPISVSPTSNTTYTVTVTNANNCSATATATVNVNNSLTPTISTSSPIICLGESVTLEVTPGTSYTWSNSNTTQSISVSPANNTAYNVTVTNGVGCSGTASVTVAVNALPSVPTISSIGSTIFCNGDSVVLSSSIANSYLWNNGATTRNVTISNNGNYSVTVSDANNCSRASTGTTVTVFNNPNAVINPALVTICSGESATLIASGGIAYTWSNNLGNGAVKTVSPIANEIYIVTVTDANNCTASATKNVSVNQPSSKTIDKTICSNETYFFNNQNLNTTDTYFDTLQNTIGCDSVVILNLNVVNVLTTIIDTSICDGAVYVFDGNNLTTTDTYYDTLVSNGGCDSIVTLNLIVNSLPTVSFSLSIETLCTNAGTLNLSGGLPAGGDYSGSGINNNILDPSALPDGDLIISYLYEDANGCSNTAIDTLTIETCIGIENTSINNIEVTLYPNPTDKYVIVSSELLKDLNTTILIHDATGKTINLIIQQTDITKRIIHTESIAKGVYWVTIKNENYTSIKRFVKAE